MKMIKWISGVVLAIVTLGAVADLSGIGAYVAPPLLPVLFLAAWDSHGLMKVIWTVLALPCGWVVGYVVANPQLYSDHAIYGEEPPPVALAYVASLITLAIFMIPIRYGHESS